MRYNYLQPEGFRRSAKVQEFVPISFFLTIEWFLKGLVGYI
jgi:hypothetical protein